MGDRSLQRTSEKQVNYQTKNSQNSKMKAVFALIAAVTVLACYVDACPDDMTLLFGSLECLEHLEYVDYSSEETACASLWAAALCMEDLMATCSAAEMDAMGVLDEYNDMINSVNDACAK